MSRLGGKLTRFQGDELGSVMTTTGRHMSFLDSLAIRDNTMTSSFDPAELANGKMTVYLVLPPDQIDNKSGLLRTWIGSMLRAVVKGGLQEKNLVHFILDEAASLGACPFSIRLWTSIAPTGSRCQFYYQSMGQLLKCWPNGAHQTLLSNTAQVFFRVNDPDTAKYVSERLGQATVIVTSGGTNTGTSASEDNRGGGNHGSSGGKNHNWNQVGRSLKTTDEVMAMNKREAITFIPGVRPIWTMLARYYEPGFNQEPGKLWPAVRTLGLSVVLLLAAAIVALTVNGAFRRSPNVRAVHRGILMRGPIHVRQAEPRRLAGADPRGVNMANMNLEGVDLRASDVSGANFSGSNLRYADFRGARIVGANFQNASLYAAKMQGVEANQADFRGSDLRMTNFGGAYMEGVVLPGVSPGRGVRQALRQGRRREGPGRRSAPCERKEGRPGHVIIASQINPNHEERTSHVNRARAIRSR